MFLAKRGSDHRPILRSLVSFKELYRGYFRFDKRFLNKPHVKETIIHTWNQPLSFGQRGHFVAERLRACRKALSSWKKDNNVNSRDRIVQIQRALEFEKSSNFPNFYQVRMMKKDLVLAYKEEEMFWSQRSSDKWCVEGDRNTKFFHASVKASRGKKRILKLMDKNGNFQRVEAFKGEIVVSYFQELFSFSSPVNFSDIFEGFSPKVSVEMNEQLVKEVTS